MILLLVACLSGCTTYADTERERLEQEVPFCNPSAPYVFDVQTGELRIGMDILNSRGWDIVSIENRDDYVGYVIHAHCSVGKGRPGG